MQVSNVGSPTSGTEPQAQGPKRTNDLGRDEFMRLLLTQMSNQDPTSPQTNEQFIAQLATFTSVELAQSSNKRLEDLLVAQTANNQMSAINLVGKEVTFGSDAIDLPETGGTSFAVDLQGAATQVSAVIVDANGKEIRRIEYGAKDAGTTTLEWDGRDASGTPAPPGTYTVRVAASDINGGSIDVETRGKGRVDGVTFANGYAQVKVGDRILSLSDLTEIRA